MDAAPRILIIIVPVFLMIVAAPLFLKKIPKNGFYGFRTPKTMSGSDEQWYRVNREGGIRIFIAGSISLLACVIVPLFVKDQREIVQLCSLILVATMLIACGIETIKHWS